MFRHMFKMGISAALISVCFCHNYFKIHISICEKIHWIPHKSIVISETATEVKEIRTLSDAICFNDIFSKYN